MSNETHPLRPSISSFQSTEALTQGIHQASSARGTSGSEPLLTVGSIEGTHPTSLVKQQVPVLPKTTSSNSDSLNENGQLTPPLKEALKRYGDQSEGFDNFRDYATLITLLMKMCAIIHSLVAKHQDNLTFSQAEITQSLHEATANKHMWGGIIAAFGGGVALGFAIVGAGKTWKATMSDIRDNLTGSMHKAIEADKTISNLNTKIESLEAKIAAHQTASHQTTVVPQGGTGAQAQAPQDAALAQMQKELAGFQKERSQAITQLKSAQTEIETEATRFLAKKGSATQRQELNAAQKELNKAEKALVKAEKELVHAEKAADKEARSKLHKGPDESMTVEERDTRCTRDTLLDLGAKQAAYAKAKIQLDQAKQRFTDATDDIKTSTEVKIPTHLDPKRLGVSSVRREHESAGASRSSAPEKHHADHYESNPLGKTKTNEKGEVVTDNIDRKTYEEDIAAKTKKNSAAVQQWSHAGNVGSMLIFQGILPFVTGIAIEKAKSEIQGRQVVSEAQQNQDNSAKSQSENTGSSLERLLTTIIEGITNTNRGIIQKMA